MYQMLDVHPATLVIVMAAFLVTPFYLLATYVFSGASARKGFILGCVFLLWGSMMAWFCMANVINRVGTPLGNLFLPLFWILPSLGLYAARDWVLVEPLSQRWLIGLQLFRAIGAVFLIEMARGNLPGVFALPAGIGDLLVAAFAAAVLWKYRNADDIPVPAILVVAVLGAIDFISAFFFGFTSSAGPQQIFFPEVPNDTLLFPTGLIPLFLVPYAIFFHTLSILNLRRATVAGPGEVRPLKGPT